MEKDVIHLTVEQAAVLHNAQEPTLFDPTTQRFYVAITAEMYDKLRDLLRDADEQASWQKLVNRGRAALLKDNSTEP